MSIFHINKIVYDLNYIIILVVVPYMLMQCA